MSLEGLYRFADKALGGVLPGGGTGNALSNAARPLMEKIPFLKEAAKDGLNTRRIHTNQAEAEKFAQQKLKQLRQAMKNGTYTPAMDRNYAKSVEEKFKHIPADEKPYAQYDLLDPRGSTVERNPSISDSAWAIAESSVRNYRMPTGDTPGSGMEGCVESLQRVLESAQQERIAGSDNPLRPYAGNIDELRSGIVDTGRGYLVPIHQAQPGDIGVQKNKYGYGTHAVVVTNRRDPDGNLMFNSNSGSHGSFSYAGPLVDDPDGATYEIYRLGKRPKPPRANGF